MYISALWNYPFKKRKVALFVVLWIVAVMVWFQKKLLQCFSLPYDEHHSLSNDELKYYDVLLNGYMRSGSTLTGKLLGWREDTIYLYEPFWKISTWSYWHGTHKICRTDYLKCRLSNGSYEVALGILNNFFDCSFHDFERTVFQRDHTDKLGGPSWKETAICIKHNETESVCVQKFIPKICKTAKHRATKVLRLSTDLFEDLLRNRKNLKVIHLFRDPRGIINSRLQTDWYQKVIKGNVIGNAKSLCNKMYNDFREGKRLYHIYPDRFRFIYYEDLIERPYENAKTLNRYLGMNLDDINMNVMKELSIFKVETDSLSTNRHFNSAFWWKMSLKFDIVLKIQSVCKDTLKALNYTFFESLKDLRNMSIKSVSIPKDYKIN